MIVEVFLRVTLCCLCVTLCLSCSEERSDSKPHQPTHTLVFMDKSLSTNSNLDYVAQKYNTVLDGIVAENVRTTGDQITVYFIHENTAQARALSLTVRSEKDDVGNASPTDVEAAQMAFDLSLQREKARFRKQLAAKLAQQNTGLSNQRTDVLASISLIAEAGADGDPVTVYYLSDMVESMPARLNDQAPRRDFHKTPPATEAQADEWAKADVKTFADLSFGSPTIRIALPFEPTASRKVNNPAVSRYWQTLFGELGAAEVEEL